MPAIAAHSSLYPSLDDMGLDLPPDVLAEHHQALALYQPQVEALVHNSILNTFTICYCAASLVMDCVPHFRYVAATRCCSGADFF